MSEDKRDGDDDRRLQQEDEEDEVGDELMALEEDAEDVEELFMQSSAFLELNETLDALDTFAGHLEATSRQLELRLTQVLHQVRSHREVEGAAEGQKQEEQAQRHDDDADDDADETRQLPQLSAFGLDQESIALSLLASATSGNDSQAQALSLEQLRTHLRAIAEQSDQLGSDATCEEAAQAK
eukprot:m.151032 g.151032  ORF g.151032 m.151032 type:complete len:183 (+) comp16191_c0_seq1:99-647(+)